MGNSNPVYQYVTERIVKAVEAGGLLPWQKPWVGGRPMNAVTKKPYRGINAFLLSLSGYESPYWLTLKQCLALGGRVVREEFANKSMVTFWNIRKYKLVNDKRQYLPNDALVFDGKAFLLRYYWVYNADQCTGLPTSLELKKNQFDPIEACEKVWNGYENKPTLEHGNDGAYYSPAFDKIGMPQKNTFVTNEEYYGVLFHEAIHSTGHHSRLDREGIGKGNAFGSEKYSKEELIAEMGASFLCAETGIRKNIDNSAAYIKNWLDKIKEEPKLLVSAASQAEKAVDLMLGKSLVEEEDLTEETVNVVEEVTA